MTEAPVWRERLLAMLHQHGVAEVLRALNARVPHRYTGIYRLRDGLLTNIFLHDKQGEATPTALAVVPLDISFCQFVFRDQLFRTDNSTEDRRLDGNPFQGQVLSYHGVPLVDGSGELYGSLCHFDLQPWGISDEEFAHLQLAATLMPEFLPNS